MGLGHLACALAPGFEALLWLRPLSVLGAAVFTPQVAVVLAQMVPPAQRATAISSAFVGWSLAAVLGMPIGNLLADALSWRASFAAVGALALLAALAVWRVVPAGLQVAPLLLRSWGEVLGNPRLRWILLATRVRHQIAQVVDLIGFRFDFWHYTAASRRCRVGASSPRVSKISRWMGSSSPTPTARSWLGRMT